ncbi:MAG TPA: glycogen/starch/alpha-glucan family phosphorylase, partial [bacterium]|nr:glycogen/starch/alpha-glucan family phosphorylase [bacterium]
MVEKKNNEITKEEFLATYRKQMTAEGLRLSILNHLHYTRAKEDFLATDYDKYLSLCWAIRDRIVERWNKTQQTYYTKDAKRVYYLSLEFLLGRLILNNLINIDLYEKTKYVVKNFGYDFQKLIEIESDAGLGNGGLGRLAACYLDSMATLGYPGYGYGIRYEFGIFNQIIKDGYQVEEPEVWLQYGYPWEIERPEYSQTVKFFGKLERYFDENGKERYKWVDTQEVLAIPYDIPIIGYRNNTVNTLRLWGARSSKQFDLKIFNHGDYIKAVEDKNYSENISRVLYPNDNIYEGKELRLKQQYFFVSATLQDIMRRFTKSYDDFNKLPDKVAIQLNDTHPTLAIPELMRILVDEYNLPFKKAWEITSKTFGYTNHTVLPEALEKWPLNLMQNLLPRHMQLIFDINCQFLTKIRVEHSATDSMVRELSIIEEGGEKFVKMANLAIIGSHKVNGVAGLHSEIIKNEIFAEFNKIYPGKFINITNGITQRRWLLLANPKLAELITEKIGDKWTIDLYELKKLLKFENDKEFLEQLAQIKKHNKKRLAQYVSNEQNINLDINSIFDCQTKRMHEYKRQLLNVLHILHLYNQLKDNPNLDINPMTFIFSGKSAPG